MERPRGARCPPPRDIALEAEARGLTAAGCECRGDGAGVAVTSRPEQGTWDAAAASFTFGKHGLSPRPPPRSSGPRWRIETLSGEASPLSSWANPLGRLPGTPARPRPRRCQSTGLQFGLGRGPWGGRSAASPEAGLAAAALPHFQPHPRLVPYPQSQPRPVVPLGPRPAPTPAQVCSHTSRSLPAQRLFRSGSPSLDPFSCWPGLSSSPGPNPGDLRLPDLGLNPDIHSQASPPSPVPTPTPKS